MSYQVYFTELKDHVQTEMLAEFSGKEGKKQTLIDVEKEKNKLANKPLPGQLEFTATDEAEHLNNLILGR